MELIFEIFFELYIELMMLVAPEEKAASKKYRIMAIFIAVFVVFGVLALFIWGCVLISDYNNKLGIIPIVIAVIISVVQIIARIILNDKKSKE